MKTLAEIVQALTKLSNQNDNMPVEIGGVPVEDFAFEVDYSRKVLKMSFKGPQPVKQTPPPKGLPGTSKADLPK